MTKYEAPSTDDRRIWDLWLTGTYQSAIVAADDAGIFAALAEEPATIDGLAQRLDFDVRATGILLRLLGALDLVAQRESIYQLTDQARLYLVKSSPFYWGNMMRVRVSAWHRDTLLTKLKGKGSAEAAGPEAAVQRSPSKEPVDGWAAGKIGIGEATAIAASMHSHSFPVAIGAARNYDFTDIERILDVGGGSGCFMIAFAQAHQSSRPRSWSFQPCARSLRRTSRAAVSRRRSIPRQSTCSASLAEGLRRALLLQHLARLEFPDLRVARRARVRCAALRRTHHAARDAARRQRRGPGDDCRLLDADAARDARPAIHLRRDQGALEQAGFKDIRTQHTAAYYSITTGYKR